MKHSTYSFTDVNMAISHPDYGSFSVQGEGIGDITISKQTDRTVHDVAADGSIMVSKIAGNNGTVTVNAQQTSPLHTWLQGLFNYVWSQPTDKWAQISITLTAPKMGRTIQCTGGAFVKEPDAPFQSQGQRVPWGILCTDIQELPF